MFCPCCMDSFNEPWRVFPAYMNEQGQLIYRCEYCYSQIRQALFYRPAGQ